LQEEERALVLEVWKVYDKKGENQVNVADLPTIFQVNSPQFFYRVPNITGSLSGVEL
jgi:hypothetical protein